MNFPLALNREHDASIRDLARWAWIGIQGIFEILYPIDCPICQVPVERGLEDRSREFGFPFCDACRSDLIEAAGLRCERCAMPIGPYSDPSARCGLCRSKRFVFEKAFVLGAYSGSLRDLVLEMKNISGEWLGVWIPSILIDARPQLRELALKDPKTLIVPVPLHWRRRMERGYNQAEELAAGLARRLRLKRANPLRRARWNVKLAGLGRVRRESLLKDSFEVKRFSRSRIRGRTIILVDDVLTTGATANAAARALKRGGAARVIVAAVARSEGKPYA